MYPFLYQCDSPPPSSERGVSTAPRQSGSIGGPHHKCLADWRSDLCLMFVILFSWETPDDMRDSARESGDFL